MTDLAFLSGVDWGSQTHHACLVDREGELLGEQAFPQGGAGLGHMADGFLATVGVAGSHRIGVAIETPHGPVVETLMERGFAVHAINPKQLDRFRDRFSPAGAKDDRRDARTLCDALRTDRHAFRLLDPAVPEIVELREWARIAHDLTRDRTRLVNRARQQLWRYYPQLLKVEGDLARDWVRELWSLVPTPEKARRIRTRTVAALLKRHRVRRLTAEDVLNRLREPPLTVAPGTTEAAIAHLEIVFAQLHVVTQQLARAQQEIDHLLDNVPSVAHASPQTRPEMAAQHDVEILRSLPGVGRTVLATLLAEAYDPLQRRDHQALRCLSGTAPVTRRSGKSTLVVRRLAAHNRLQNAIYHWANVAIQHHAHSKAKYTTLRARGHGHARAPRSVADRLLAVACAMLQSQTVFNPEVRIPHHAA